MNVDGQANPAFSPFSFRQLKSFDILPVTSPSIGKETFSWLLCWKFLCTKIDSVEHPTNVQFSFYSGMTILFISESNAGKFGENEVGKKNITSH